MTCYGYSYSNDDMKSYTIHPIHGQQPSTQTQLLQEFLASNGSDHRNQQMKRKGKSKAGKGEDRKREGRLKLQRRPPIERSPNPSPTGLLRPALPGTPFAAPAPPPDILVPTPVPAPVPALVLTMNKMQISDNARAQTSQLQSNDSPLDCIHDHDILEQLVELQRKELVQIEAEEVSIAMQRASVTQNLQQVLQRLDQLHSTPS